MAAEGDASPRESGGTGARGSASSPWLPALLVVGALALAHVGLGLLLTRSARGAIHEVEAAWTAEELAAAKAPGAQPETRGEEWSRWQREQRLWTDAEVRADRKAQVGAFTWPLAVSFALQAGFVLWLAVRASTRSARS
jgi:hypothetical protein